MSNFGVYCRDAIVCGIDQDIGFELSQEVRDRLPWRPRSLVDDALRFGLAISVQNLDMRSLGYSALGQDMVAEQEEEARS